MASRKITLRSSPYITKIRGRLRSLAGEAVSAAEAIADLAEPPMKEFASSKLLAEMLSGHGFRVTFPWKDIPTAFKAVRGAGRPRIALLSEYDALPDCGKRAGLWGHGCGHNLLGVASATAGIAASDVLTKEGKGGQVVVFGTPAEEALSGKVLMAEKGAFRGLDAVLAWHPGAENRAMLAGGLAMTSLSFSFTGRTAHAAGAPHKGRSALDGAILTDIAVNYMREHVEDNARIHCVIPNGGSAPNVVPDKAEIWYYVRGRDRKQVDELIEWVINCAKGAAMATQTRVRTLFHDSVTERITNETVTDMMDAVMRRCGPAKFTPAEATAAAKLLPGKKYKTSIEEIGRQQGKGSSDEDNVSWFAPLGRISVACVPKDTIGHHRQYAAAVRIPGAHRGMLKAAEYLSTGGMELVTNRPLLAKATKEFKQKMKGKKYMLPSKTAERAYGDA